MSAANITGFSLKRAAAPATQRPRKSILDHSNEVQVEDDQRKPQTQLQDRSKTIESVKHDHRTDSIPSPSARTAKELVDNESDSEDEEDSYLSMIIEDKRPESSLQRREREKRERWERAHPLSKAELHAQHIAKIEEGLATKMDDSNKGAQMLKRMGFKGGALGVSETAAAEPLVVSLKAGRGGIGLDAEKKRTLQEAAAESAAKRPKIDVDEFREQMKTEKMEKRVEGQLVKAMGVLEELHEREIDAARDSKDSDSIPIDQRPLHRVPLLYRPLTRDRRDAEQNRLLQARSAMGRLHDRNFNGEDYEHEDPAAELQEAIDEQQDDELEEFLALTAIERRDRVLQELRERYCYCIWCGHRYKDRDELDSECPGSDEDDHEV